MGRYLQALSTKLAPLPIENEAASTLQATSVLLVFLTLLFTLRYPEIAADLQMENLGEKVKERAKRVRELKVRVITHLLPVVLGGASLSWLQAPLVGRIVAESRLELWSFDILPTAIVMVEVWVITITVWSLALTILLMRKIRGLS